MPEVTITIGGRQFAVACQDGEEHYLHTAAKMLDDEAQVLADQVGRLPESRMLLMAGLMLADKTASVEDRVTSVEAKLAERDAELEGLRNMGAPEPERIARVREAVGPDVPIVVGSGLDGSNAAELLAHADAAIVGTAAKEDGDVSRPVDPARVRALVSAV